MIVKTVNDIADDNDLIFTLLMFDAYLRMQKFDSSFSIIFQKANAIEEGWGIGMCVSDRCYLREREESKGENKSKKSL